MTKAQRIKLKKLINDECGDGIVGVLEDMTDRPMSEFLHEPVGEFLYEAVVESLCDLAELQRLIIVRRGER